MFKYKHMLMGAFLACFAGVASFIYAATTDDLSVSLTIPEIIHVAWGPRSVSATATTSDITDSTNITFDTIILTAESSAETGFYVTLSSSEASGTQLRLTGTTDPAETINLTLTSNQNAEGTLNTATAFGATEIIINAGEYPYSSAQSRTLTLVAAGSDIGTATEDVYTATITATITAK